MEDINEKIHTDAIRVLRYDAKHKSCGGYELSHKPCSYGLIIKYILYTKRLTYIKAGQLLGITPQGVNHCVNRMEKDRFDEDMINRYCEKLKIDVSYFYSLAEEIERIQNNK